MVSFSIQRTLTLVHKPKRYNAEFSFLHALNIKSLKYFKRDQPQEMEVFKIYQYNVNKYSCRSHIISSIITITIIIIIIIKDFSGNLCIQGRGQELRPHHLKNLKAIGFLSKTKTTTFNLVCTIIMCYRSQINIQL